MPKDWPSRIAQLRQQVGGAVIGPAALAFIPAFSLAAYWFGGEGALIVMTALLPLLYLFAGNMGDRILLPRHAVTGPLDRGAFKELVAKTFDLARNTDRQAATFVISIDDFEELTERYGQIAADTVGQRVADRILSVLRNKDSLARLGESRFAVCTEPVRHMDIEMCIQLASRVQTAIEEPISIDGMTVFVTASVGFCQHSRAPRPDGASWLNAASIALREAQLRGPSAVRAFSDQMRQDAQVRAELCEEVAGALENGQIQPWFQPQISTDTGQITGFEALARWSHPTRGMISPPEFLKAIEEAGQIERLGEVMIYHSFAALKAWDGAGVDVPHVGVNFTGSELSNPKLLDKIKWELDRFGLAPDRLAVEVLETVVASAPDDIVTLNINALGRLGCRIDLDDFGTGHASISSIRRFSVSRIKIDRSFVMKSDRDPEQQRMISAILTMAERLGVETLAEGVETVGEHVLLAQLGCDHVQGFGIARPMPFEQTLDWIAKHSAKLQDVPRIMNNRSR